MPYINWKSYIQEKFGHTAHFRILHLEEDFVEIRSADSFISTVIEFIFADDLETLEGVSFWGSDEVRCGYWHAPYDVEGNFIPQPYQKNIMPKHQGAMLENFPFEENFIQKLENDWLAIPLHRGWTETNVLIDDMLDSSTMVTKNNKSEPLEILELNELTLAKKIRKGLNLGVQKQSHHFKPIL